MEKKKKMTAEEREAAKNRLLKEITLHVGATRRIGMGELFERIFAETYSHRINDTRRLRTIITELRREGVPIVSKPSGADAGYFLASAGSELVGYCRRLRNSALKKLALEATLRKMTLPELMGQLMLDFGAGSGEQGAASHEQII